MTDQIKKLERQIEDKQLFLKAFEAIENIANFLVVDEVAETCRNQQYKLTKEIAELRRAEDKRKQPEVNY